MKICPGDASEEVPPVPIPNTEVKLFSAEDTWGATSWENRSSPGYFISGTFYGLCTALRSVYCVSPDGRTGGAVGILDDVNRACPLIALAGDRHATIDGPDGAHRCHAIGPPGPLARSQQAQLCLTPAHQRCELFTAHVARRGGGTPGRAPLTDGLVSTRLLLAPEPAWRGVAGRARRARPGPLFALAGAALVAGVGGIFLVSALFDEKIDLALVARPSVAASPIEVATATPSPTATSAPPLVTATAEPTTAATPASTLAPTPAPQQTYVVAEGDTLALIAQQFGTTVEELQSVNGIDDPDQINLGQVLVIP